jgi:hypothetical protein
MSSLHKYDPYAAQVVFSYEELSLSPEDISAQFIDADEGLTPAIVSSLLEKHSTKYRVALRGMEKSVAVGASANQLEQLMTEYRNLAFCSDNDLVRERALKNLINEVTGRNDIPKEMLKLKSRDTAANEVNTAMRISQFTEQMTKNREMIANTMKNFSSATNPEQPADPSSAQTQTLELAEA